MDTFFERMTKVVEARRGRPLAHGEARFRALATGRSRLVVRHQLKHRGDFLKEARAIHQRVAAMQKVRRG